MENSAAKQAVLRVYALSYLDARRSGYSWPYFARRFGVWYLIGAVIAVVSFLALWLLDAPQEYYVFVAGSAAGCVLRDVAWFLSSRATWLAVTEKFIDWDVVEKLAAEDAEAGSASN